MRVESSVTAISWIPSEAVEGLAKLPFSFGVAHYDQAPPDRLVDVDLMHRADLFREANELKAWIDVDDGKIVDSGHAGEGVLALERYLLQFPGNTAARVELARAYFVLGEYVRAREEFENVLRDQRWCSDRSGSGPRRPRRRRCGCRWRRWFLCGIRDSRAISIVVSPWPHPATGLPATTANANGLAGFMATCQERSVPRRPRTTFM